MGRTELTPYSLELSLDNSFHLHHRYFNKILYDDLFLQQELDIISKHISPTDICLQTINRASNGSLRRYCSELYIVVWDNIVLS